MSRAVASEESESTSRAPEPSSKVQAKELAMQRLELHVTVVTETGQTDQSLPGADPEPALQSLPNELRQRRLEFPLHDHYLLEAPPLANHSTPSSA
ncbi:hypothetical protein PM082_021513 [Marasmius tenuissimus]|nr:hypothetical protein PM082_021513 [Marasmius tenuissimus]